MSAMPPAINSTATDANNKPMMRSKARSNVFGKNFSADAALRIKAAHLGLEATEHHPVGRSAATRSAGWITVEADHQLIDRLYRAGAVVSDEVDNCGDLHENEFAILRCGSQSALTRCTGR